MGLIDGKVVLVTGAASGIGRATARLAHAEGARAVVVTDRDADGGAETVRLIQKDGGTALFAAADVAAEPEVADVVRRTIERYGRLDAAVNCAGIEGNRAAIAELGLDDWRRVLDVNLTGVFLCLKHELRAMLANGSGAVVNIASMAGSVAVPQLAPYCSSKHAVLGLTKTAAQEYARRGIRVNAVCPGVIDTPMLRASMGGDPEREARLRRTSITGELGTPEQVAAAAVWLLSDAASYVSGISMPVDAGTVAR